MLAQLFLNKMEQCCGGTGSSMMLRPKQKLVLTHVFTFLNLIVIVIATSSKVSVFYYLRGCRSVELRIRSRPSMTIGYTKNKDFASHLRPFRRTFTEAAFRLMGRGIRSFAFRLAWISARALCDSCARVDMDHAMIKRLDYYKYGNTKKGHNRNVFCGVMRFVEKLYTFLPSRQSVQKSRGEGHEPRK